MCALKCICGKRVIYICNGYKKYSDYFIEIPAKICISPVYCLVMRGSIAPSAGTWKSTYMTATRVLLVVL